MNKKLLLVGLTSGLFLASCGASTSALSKKVHFKNIVSKNSEVELLSNQVEEGFNYLSSIKAKTTYTDYYFNSVDEKEKKVEIEELDTDFFKNGYIHNGSYETKVEGTTFEKNSFTYKTAITDDTIYYLEEDSDGVIPSYSKSKIDTESGETKEAHLNMVHRMLGTGVIPLYDLFGNNTTTNSFSFERSVVGKISNKKIGAYYEYKNTYVFNEKGSESQSYSQIESGYCYMEAKLDGDVYKVSKFEQKEQLIGNIYDGNHLTSGGHGSSYIKLDDYEVLSETETSIKLKYNKGMSDFTESSELSSLVTNFPTWFINDASVKVSVYLPVIDPETKEITNVIGQGNEFIYPLSVSEDLHSFEAALTNADSNYLIKFTVVAEIKTYDEEGSSEYYYFDDVVEPTNGASYGETVVDDVKYYKGSANKVYNFSVKLAFDAEAEEGEELTVAEFNIA